MSEWFDRCEVCQALLDEEDLFCANCGTEAAEHQRGEAGPPQQTTHKFECRGCGASMSYDARAKALRCPFCASVDLARRDDGKTLGPRKVVPFQIEQHEATAAMRRWLGSSFWRPSDLSEQAMVVAMTPVYVPYWVFSAHTHTYWTADTNQTPPGARGDWYPLFGEHRGTYDGLLIGASKALANRETELLAPFDLALGLPPEEVDLENITFEQFSLPRKYARPLARQGLEQAEGASCQSLYVPGQCRNLKVNVRIEGLTSEPVLLPVWIMAYRYRDQVYRFLVNGQTGRAAGQAPTSWLKILAAAGIGLLAVLLLLLLIAALAG